MLGTSSPSLNLLLFTRLCPQGRQQASPGMATSDDEPAPAPMPASSKVLGTYELMEQILLELPLSQLLLSQKINKAAFDVVKTSPTIKRALFLTPTSKPVTPVREDGLYRWKEPGCDDDKTVILNPFLEIRNVEFYTTHNVTQRRALPFDKDSVILTHSNRKDRHRRFICRWPKELEALGGRGKMLITHPPVSHLRLTSLDDGDSTVIESDDADGVVHEQMVDASSSTWYRHSSIVTSSTRKKKALAFDIGGSAKWLQFKGNVDTVSGVEMLDMLEMMPQDLLQQGLVFLRR